MLYAAGDPRQHASSVLHVRAPIYTHRRRRGVRNGYTVRFLNKRTEPADFELAINGLPGATLTSVLAKTLPNGHLAVSVDPDATLEIPVYVSTPANVTAPKSTPITFTATDLKTGEHSVVTDNFFGP